jgi:hypothetical protein
MQIAVFNGNTLHRIIMIEDAATRYKVECSSLFPIVIVPLGMGVLYRHLPLARQEKPLTHDRRWRTR